MNNSPSIANNTGRYPPEFQQVLQAHSLNFVGRGFVFTAISNFLQRYDRGYFTIVGTPGSGKSAILAKYVRDNPQVVYYNAQVAGKNRADVFLAFLCTQFTQPLAELSLQSLLQQVSNQLQPQERLIIAIDGVDAIDRSFQSPSSNLFYLPRYLPQGIYFLLSRRPFMSGKSGLLLEAPSQLLDLREYVEENRQDVRGYIRSYLTPLPDALRGGLRDDADGECRDVADGECRDVACNVSTGDLLSERNINEEEFIAQLTADSENNFMYVSQILAAIGEGFYPQSLRFDGFPAGLEVYYQQHFQKMIPESASGEVRELRLSVLAVLVQAFAPISADAIAQIIDTDEYDIQAVLDNWVEFLTLQQIDGEIRYCLYHSSFRHFLSRELTL